MPANEKRGETTVTLGGEEVTYRLTAQACEEFKAATGITVLQASTRLQKAIYDDSELDEVLLFRLFYVGVRQTRPTLTWEQFRELADIEDLGGFLATFTRRLNVAFGVEANPLTAAEETAPAPAS